MSIVHYLSSTVLKNFKKNRIADSSKILGGTNEEAEQNQVASFYHS